SSVRPYSLSLHDALPIWARTARPTGPAAVPVPCSSGDLVVAHQVAVRLALADADEHVLGQPVVLAHAGLEGGRGAQVVFGMRNRDRKSTRLNSSHVKISY